jgi:hypothetical protein
MAITPYTLEYFVEATVSAARKRGEVMARPCQVCGSEKAVAHHEDYTRPLDLTWLCRTHHQLRHSEINLALFGRKQVGFPYAWVFEFGLDRCRTLVGRRDIATFPAKRAFLGAA